MRRAGVTSVLIAGALAVSGIVAAPAPAAAAPTTVALIPVADAYGNAGAPTTNFGTSASLSSRGTPGAVSFLRFAVPAVPTGSTLTSATLRIRTTTDPSAPSADSHEVRIAGAGWEESTLTWTNRPPGTGALLGSITGATAVSLPITTVLDPAPLAGLSATSLDIAVLGSGTDSLYFWSRHAATALWRPTLTLTYTPGSGTDTTPPSTPQGLTVSSPGTRPTLTWAPSTDDVAVTSYEVHRSPTAGFTPGTGTRVGTTPGTSLLDATASSGTWHYRVVALDAAGNSSAPSVELTVSLIGSTAAPQTLLPVADTYANAGAPAANFGTSGSLSSRGTPGAISFLRFTTTAPPSGAVLTAATLSVRTTTDPSAPSTDAHTVRLASDAWSETTLTWNNRPSSTGTLLGALAPVPTLSTPASATLSPAALAPVLGTTFSIAISSSGPDSLWFWSRHAASTSYRPVLSLTFAADVVVAPTIDPTTVHVMAVGDIACAPGSLTTSTKCRAVDVATAIAGANPDYLIADGDLQYDSGTYAEFLGSYDTTFGRFKPRTLPVIGNHEYVDPRGPASGYFTYFDPAGSGAFGANPAGYYTRLIGSWRFIALNDECTPDTHNGNHGLAGGCDIGSPEYTWLQSVLTTSTERCTVVAMHRSRFSTGAAHGSYAPAAPLWDLMANYGVDVVVSGHNHGSEVFQRIGVSGSGDPVADPNGIRSFVAGSGGSSLYGFSSLATPTGALTQARDAVTFGALSLTLRDGSFDWAFTPVAGQAFTNAGPAGAFSGTSETCS